GSSRCSSIGSGSCSSYLFTPTITRSPASTCCAYANAASSISRWTNPCSTAATAPPSSSTRSISSRARSSSSSVIASMNQAPPRGPELRHLLEEVVVGVEEEREALTELVRREPRVDRRLRVGDPVREGERQLLHRRRARLADVVPGDRDRVPGREPLRAVREQVRRQPHRRPRREDVVPARDVLLED